MRRSSSVCVGLSVFGLLVACCIVAQAQSAPASNPISVDVSRGLISSQVSLSLREAPPPTLDKTGRMPPAPAWSVRDTYGREIASGKFAYS